MKMADARIEFTLGTISFSGEGSEAWLSGELKKLLEAMPKLQEIAPPPPVPPAADNGAAKRAEDAPFTASLASYLKEKGGEKNQTQRFLATADWMRRKGSPNLTTSLVSKALSDNQQKKLSNPSQCLNDNVAKGFCEKKNDGFFITPDGLKALGHQ